MFLWMPLISFKPANTGLNRNHGLSGLLGFRNTSDWVEDGTCLPCVHFESCWTPTHCGHWNSVLRRHHGRYLCIGRKGMVDMRIEHISSTHVHAPFTHPTLVTKYKFRNKILKNFKTVTMEHFTSLGGLWAWSLVRLHRSHTHRAGPVLYLVSLFYPVQLI